MTKEPQQRKTIGNILSRCRWAAHRGDEANFPENTIEAFRSAVEKGAQCIETDVRLSSDDVPLLFHDPCLGSLAIEETNAAALPCPTLADLFGMPPPETTLAIELKAPLNADGYAERLSGALKKQIPAQKRDYFFITDDDLILKQIVEDFPQTPRITVLRESILSVLSSESRAEVIRRVLALYEENIIQGLCINRNLLRFWPSDSGIPLFVYTFSSARQIIRAVQKYDFALAFLSDPALARHLEGTKE